jgi:hypothetical protein
VRRLALTLLFMFGAGLAHAQAPAPSAAAIEATTAAGEKVRLLPDGRWEYVDQARQAEARKTQAAAAATQPASEGCPPGSQGGLFGIGRCIPPGDPQYNRGSMRAGGGK